MVLYVDMCVHGCVIVLHMHVELRGQLQESAPSCSHMASRDYQVYGHVILPTDSSNSPSKYLKEVLNKSTKYVM